MGHNNHCALNIKQSINIWTHWEAGNSTKNIITIQQLPDIPANQSSRSSSAEGHRTLRKYRTAVGILRVNVHRVIMLHWQRVGCVRWESEEIRRAGRREKPEQKEQTIGNSGNAGVGGGGWLPDWQRQTATGRMLPSCGPQWREVFPAGTDRSLGPAVGKPDNMQSASIHLTHDVAAKCCQGAQLSQMMNGNDYTYIVQLQYKASTVWLQVSYPCDHQGLGCPGWLLKMIYGNRL